MSLFPEKEVYPVQERPDEFPEIPVEVENKSVVTPTPSHFTSGVKDDQGQPLVSPTGAQPVTIQVPADPAKLAPLAKGGVGNSLTWFAAFWLRIFKKAVHFGWQIIVGGKKQ